MRFLSVGIPLLLLILYCCGETENDRECQLESEGFFELKSLDIKFDYGQEELFRELDATLEELSLSGISGFMVLRDLDGNEYRFSPRYEMDWGRHLDIFQLGKTYRFIIQISGFSFLQGMKVFDGESLLYFAGSYRMGDLPYYEENSKALPWLGDPFKGTELEGLEIKQSQRVRCEFRKKVSQLQAEGVSHELVTLISNLPVTFNYGKQKYILYQSQEAVLETSRGRFLIHLLDSERSAIVNSLEGPGTSFSYYIKRLQ